MKSIQKIVAVAFALIVIVGLTSCHRGSGCPTDLKVDNTNDTENHIG